MLAYGVIKAASAMDVPIPDRISVASFNDIPFSDLVHPPLTTVDLHANQLGEKAGEVLLNIIKGDAVTGGQIQPELRVRSSTSILFGS